ncbi:MAG: YeiH family protein [Gallicola sp.]|nr:YeiH family protein [Gallicola sp.]
MIQANYKGVLFSFLLALPAFFLGSAFPIIGGPVFGILIGMIFHRLIQDKETLQVGIRFTSSKVLQLAVILLGFGLNLSVIFETGQESLPIIIATITISLLLAFLLQKALSIPTKTAVLVGVGSSICGGSAIAATAPVIDADHKEIAQAMSVIFFFNVIAAILFPWLGGVIGFDTTSGNAFGVFAGTAVNDTSSVTAAASTWDSLHNLGFQTLNKAITVKLTRTLAIIPITMGLSIHRNQKEGTQSKLSIKKIVPTFILLFVAASIITTILASLKIEPEFFQNLKNLSKFFIIMAMTAIGLNTNIVQLIRTGSKPLLLGSVCWTGITSVSLLLQKILGIW